MESDLALTVRAPPSATVADVEAALDDREEWLLDTLYGLAERPDPRRVDPLSSGDRLPYDGRPYALTVVEGSVDDPTLHFDGQGFTLRVPAIDADSARRREAVVDWYRDRADDVLPSRATRVVGDADVGDVRVAVGTPGREPATLDVTEGRPLRLTLQWRLLLAPPPVQMYVVAHELARVGNEPGSAAFWDAVARLVPGYRRCRSWLRENGAGLTV